MKVKDRKEIDKRYQWDIESMYPNAQACRDDMEKARKLADSYGAYSGRLEDSAKTLTEALQKRDELWQKAERVYVYARMKRDEDNRIPEFQALCDQAQSMLAGISQATSFFAPEFARISREKLREFMSEEPGLRIYAHLIDELLRGRSHVLSAKEEKLLAGISELSGATNDTFTMLNNADIRFGTVKGEDGRPVEVTHGTYIRLMQSPDRNLRQKAYRRMYRAYEKQKNTLATLYSYNTKQDVIFARIRKYPSSIEAALFGDKVPLKVYDNLIEEVHQALPDLHRYMELRKKALGVSRLRMYDLYAPLIRRPEKYVSYEEAQEMVKRALRPLGSEYGRILDKAFEERWADVFESEGKTSGAYSFGSYDSLPYMLLNYDGRLEDVFTLIHEAGHSMHAYFTRSAQPYVYGSHSIFTAEVASTVNEALLMRQLLGEASSKEEKAYLLNLYLEEFRTTLFRQTMFAEFERATHAAVEAGEVLTAGWLSEAYAALNRTYHGPAMEQDDQIAMEWSRIPHFYNAFYVYKYATGYSAATAISAAILDGGGQEAKDYVAFLRSGESDYPIELLKMAGVDMSRPKPVRDALATFRWLLAELEELI
ncbi:MAG: oligoendopeptidase F [Eubacteriales bacterium]|nr:oligoendopeptidase F [Eubacteriales bacterium]